jgi:hypothetical protein
VSGMRSAHDGTAEQARGAPARRRVLRGSRVM